MGKGPVKIEWMVGAQTNICYNALDRNVEAGHGDRVAFYWVGNDPQDKGSITYSQLLAEVGRLVLCALGCHVCTVRVLRRCASLQTRWRDAE